MSFLDRFRRKASLFSGGSGESMADAVVINADDHFRGVGAEYEYLSRRYGRRNVDWSLVSQALTKETESGRRYDILTIRLKSGEAREIYFDITQFFGRD